MSGCQTALTAPFRQIARTSAAESVRDKLLAFVQTGRLPIGSKLPSEHELARSFGVSRPVVREALGALRAAGVLESRTGSGTYVVAVRSTKPGFLLLGRYTPDDLHEVRSQLEVPGAAAAARRRTPDQLRTLERIVAQHAGCTDVVEWVEDDVQFHVTLAEATGNELQARLVAELSELQFEQNVVAAELGGGLAAPEDEHREILDAVSRRDAGAARRAMSRHLAAIRGRFRAMSDHEGEVKGNAA